MDRIDFWTNFDEIAQDFVTILGTGFAMYLGMRYGPENSIGYQSIAPIFLALAGLTAAGFPAEWTVAYRDSRRARVCLEQDDLARAEEFATDAKHKGVGSTVTDAEEILREIANARAA